MRLNDRDKKTITDLFTKVQYYGSLQWTIEGVSEKITTSVEYLKIVFQTLETSSNCVSQPYLEYRELTLALQTALNEMARMDF